jgi:transcription initiation factor TFIID TATA-box-binding protein
MLGGSLTGVKEEIRVQNVVASAAFHQNFDLEAIAKTFPNVEYQPNVFPGLAFKLKKPRTCALIFSSGKMVCTGAKSEKQARKAILKVAKELKRSGIFITGKPEITVQNIVASGSLGKVIDLIDLCEQQHTGRLIYEPEQFPAAIYRMENSHIVFLIFSTGNIVCVGARKEKEIYEAMEKLRQRLEKKELSIRKGMME